MHRKIGHAPVAAFAMTVAVAVPVSGCMRRAIVNACRRAMLSRRCATGPMSRLASECGSASSTSGLLRARSRVALGAGGALDRNSPHPRPWCE